MINQVLNNPYSPQVGTVKLFGGSANIKGWLRCDGSAVSRTNYAALFSVIGTDYGAGDGSTTFNLPNTYSKHPLGRGGSAPANMQGTGSLPKFSGQTTHFLEGLSFSGTETSGIVRTIQSSSSTQGSGAGERKAVTLQIDSTFGGQDYYNRTDGRVIGDYVKFYFYIKY